MQTIPVYSVRYSHDGPQAERNHTELAITGSMSVDDTPITSPAIAGRLISDIPDCVCPLNLILLVLDADDRPVRVCCAKDEAIDTDCLATLLGFVGRSGYKVIIAGERRSGMMVQEHHIERVGKLVAAAAEVNVVVLDYLLVGDNGDFVSLAIEVEGLSLAAGNYILPDITVA